MQASETPGSSESPRIDPNLLRGLNLVNPEILSTMTSERVPDIVEGLIAERSCNIWPGDSGLGKTALAVSCGIAIAQGIPWLNRKVQQGAVLSLDGEMPLFGYKDLLSTLSLHAGLSAPPRDFYIWSPNWAGQPRGTVNDSIEAQIRCVRPIAVFMDPLRTFYPEAEMKSNNATNVIAFQRRMAHEYGCAFVTLHHRRKTNANAVEQADLATNPNGWLRDTAGSFALINQTDLRLGIDSTRKGPADLVINGFRRGEGVLGATYLIRERDDAGDPIGYRVATGTENLNGKFQEVYRNLPDFFHFKDVKAAVGGNSASNANAFLVDCQNVGIITKSADRNGGYQKVSSSQV